MSGMRTHMEVAGRMVHTYPAELAFMPGLSELVQSHTDMFIYGAAFPDWTHATEYAQDAATYVQEVETNIKTYAPIGGIAAEALVLAVEEYLSPILQVLKNPPPKLNVEPEHWQPFLKRYSLLLRSEAPDGRLSSDVAQRLAFFLGMGCHEAQDNVFHFTGATDPVPELGWLVAHPPAPIDARPRFRVPSALDDTIRAYELETGAKGDHGSVEMVGDLLIASYPTDVADAPMTIANSRNMVVEHDVAKIYAEIGVTPPVSAEDVGRGRNFIDLWLTALCTPQDVPSLLTDILGLDSAVPALAILKFDYPTIYADERVSQQHPEQAPFDTALKRYMQGGLDNGAAVALMNTLRWYAHFRGWYYFQNEHRAPYLDTVTSQSGPNDQTERGYTAYSGCSDIGISARVSDSVLTGGDTQVSSGAEAESMAALLRFELADNVDDTRNVPPSTTIQRATLRLFCTATPAAAPGADTAIEVYRINTPWAWGGGPEPGAPTAVPSSVIGTGSAGWRWRNQPGLLTDDFTASSLAGFRQQLRQCAHDIQTDATTVAVKIGNGPGAGNTGYYNGLLAEATVLTTAWSERLGSLQNGLMNGTWLTLKPDAPASSLTSIASLLSEAIQRITDVWTDARTSLGASPRTNDRLNALADRLANPTAQDLSQWFLALEAALGSPGYPRVAWHQPGCSAVPDDHDPQPAAVFTVPASASKGEWVVCELTGLVQSWIAAPERNCGMLLKVADNSAGNGMSIVYTAPRQDLRVQTFTHGRELMQRPMLIVQV